MRITKTKDLCWEADQLIPSVPSKNTSFIGNTVTAPWGENQVQRSCHLSKWNKVVKHSQTPCFICVLSLSLLDEMELPHIFVLPAEESQKVKRQNKKHEIEKKKRYFQRRKNYFQSLSWSKIKLPYVLQNMLPRELLFVLLYSVCSYATLKTSSWASDRDTETKLSNIAGAYKMMDYIHQSKDSNRIWSCTHQTPQRRYVDLGSLNMSLFHFHFQPDLKLRVTLVQHGHFGNNSPDLIYALMKEL